MGEGKGKWVGFADLRRLRESFEAEIHASAAACAARSARATRPLKGTGSLVQRVGARRRCQAPKARLAGWGGGSVATCGGPASRAQAHKIKIRC